MVRMEREKEREARDGMGTAGQDLRPHRGGRTAHCLTTQSPGMAWLLPLLQPPTTLPIRVAWRVTCVPCDPCVTCDRPGGRRELNLCGNEAGL